MTGKISPSQWASAVEAVLHLDLPWRTLRSRLVHLDQDGNVEYHSSFDAVEIELPIKEVRYVKVQLVLGDLQNPPLNSSVTELYFKCFMY